MTLGKIRRSWPKALIPSVALMAQFAIPGLAHAQDESDAQETAAARTLAVDGVKLAQADQCGEAIDKLDRAEKLKHSAIVLSHLGQCQVKVGKWVEGSESLRKMVREPLPENPSPALEEAYKKAQLTLRDLKPRIPSVRIMVAAPREANLSLKIDGQDVPSTVIGVALPADPGDHVIEVSAPGYLRASAPVKLVAGASASVQLELKRDPAAPEPRAETAPVAEQKQPVHFEDRSPAPAPLASEERTSGAGKVLAYVAYGVGAAGLGVGIGFGAAASSAESSLRTSCPNRVCPPDREDELSSAKTKGTISTIGFATAGGGALLGTLFLVLSGSSSRDTGKATAPHTTAGRGGVRTLAKVGLGSVALAGEF
jgi:hypothetical protein